jgi:hypothetical protein
MYLKSQCMPRYSPYQRVGSAMCAVACHITRRPVLARNRSQVRSETPLGETFRWGRKVVLQ